MPLCQRAFKKLSISFVATRERVTGSALPGSPGRIPIAIGIPGIDEVKLILIPFGLLKNVTVFSKTCDGIRQNL